MWNYWQDQDGWGSSSPPPWSKSQFSHFSQIVICQNGVAVHGIYRLISKVISKRNEGEVHWQWIPSKHKRYCSQQRSRLEVPDILLPQPSKISECHPQTIRTLNQLKSCCPTSGKFGGTVFLTLQFHNVTLKSQRYSCTISKGSELIALKGTRSCLSL